MQKIKRILEEKILENLKKENSKINIIYGARQVGKTTLAKQIISKLGLKTLEINGDENIYNEILSSQNKEKIESLISGYEMIFIDEAQRIKNIGINLKIIFDNFPDLKILVTGSSSFDLANEINEPLTGRKFSYELFPISFSELKNDFNNFELNQKFGENFLVFGSYPDILSEKNILEKKKKLIELSNSYLYKDILLLENLKHSDKLIKLLKLLAFQIGQEVSINELSQSLRINNETTVRYINLLEKSFIIYRLGGFSRNLRKEISKSDKIYFWDLGVRNILIGNLNDLENRNDIGNLWENFLINERLKTKKYNGDFFSYYFWRIYTGAEIDYIEEEDGKLNTFEFKWGNKKVKMPKTFLKNYPKSNFELINQENYLEFILNNKKNRKK